MALLEVEDTISQHIKAQFPSIYESEDSQLFINFAKAYYEWLEQSGQVIGQSRDQLKQIDIDQTTSQFIEHFKKTYLFSIPEETTVDFPFLIKHILDLYRSKGSQRALELFFKLVYNKNVELYLPGEHIFSTSAAEYVRPRYVEVYEASSIILESFLGKKITGGRSGATAYVSAIVETRGRNPDRQDYVVRSDERHDAGIIHVLFLEDLVGDFERDELVGNDLYSVRTNGSLSDLSFSFSGPNFEVGQQLTVEQQNGEAVPGVVEVTSLRNASGIPDFTLNTGGSGYSINNLYSNVVISEQLLTVKNVRNTEGNAVNYLDSEAAGDTIVFEDTLLNGRVILEQDFVTEVTRRPATFDVYEQIVYPRMDIEFAGGTTVFANTVAAGKIIRLYDVDNKTVLGNGVVSSVVDTTPNNSFTRTGSLVIFVTEGTFGVKDRIKFESEVILTEDDDQLLYEDSSGSDSRVLQEEYNIQLEDGTGTLISEESSTDIRVADENYRLYIDGDLTKYSYIQDSTNNYVTSTFIGSDTFKSDSSQLVLGMISNTGTIIPVAQSFVRGLTSNTIGDVTGNRSPSSTANIEITRADSIQSITFNTDFITQGLYDTSLSATEFGFTKSSTANVANVLFEALTMVTDDFGAIGEIRVDSTGADYTADPIVLSQTKFLDGLLGTDVQLKYQNKALAGDEDFQINEILRQTQNVESQTLTFTNFSDTNTASFSVDDGVVQVVNSSVNTYAIVSEVVNSTALTLTDIRSINSESIVVATGHNVVFTANDVSQIGISSPVSANTVTSSNVYVNNLVVGKVLSANSSNNSINMQMFSKGSFRTTEGLDGRLQSNNNSKSAEIISIASADADQFINFDSENILGRNAKINSPVEEGTGLINSIRVKSSGYGFDQGADVILRDVNNVLLLANATAVSNGTGIGLPFNRTDTGFLSSDQSFLHDNDFYQVYSYQVLSEFPLDKYQRLLKEVIHTAGYKLFGKVQVTPILNISNNLDDGYTLFEDGDYALQEDGVYKFSRETTANNVTIIETTITQS